MSKGKKALVYFIVIFGFAIVLLGGFIFCCFNLKNATNDERLLAVDTETKKSIDKFILNSAYVCEDSFDVNLYKKYISKFSINNNEGVKMDVSEIRVPYFNLSSQETVQINTDIQSLYCTYLREFKQNYEKFINEGYDDVSKMHMVGPMILNYDAYLYNDMLSVVVYHKKPDSCYSYETYVFDVVSGKLLNVDEISSLIDFNFKEYDYHSILNRFYDGAQGNMLASTSIYNINDSLDQNKINVVRPYRDAGNGIGIFVDNSGSINLLLPINIETGDTCGQKISLITLK